MVILFWSNSISEIRPLTLTTNDGLFKGDYCTVSKPYNHVKYIYMYVNVQRGLKLCIRFKNVKSCDIYVGKCHIEV